MIAILICTRNAEAVIAFQDTFESQSLGSILGSAPEIGSFTWREDNSGTDVVQSTLVQSGSKALQVDRPVSGGQSLRGVMLYDEGRTLAGTDLIFTASWYHADAGQNAGFEANLGQAAWWAHPNGNYYTISQAGVYTDTGVAAALGAWEKVEMVLHFVDAGSPGMVNGTFDLYLTSPSVSNVRTKIAYGISIPTSSDDAYSRFYISNSGAPSTTYWDDISVTRDTAPVCGDTIHQYPTGDFNHDCRVDFKDFATLAQHWLECSDVTCP
jgi:hypothetical protein